MKNEYEKSLYTTQPKQHISTQIFFLVFDEEKYWTASNNKKNEYESPSLKLSILKPVFSDCPQYFW